MQACDQLLIPTTQSFTSGKALPSLHDHSVEDASCVVAMTRQHVGNKSYQVGTVIRQSHGNKEVVVALQRQLVPGDGCGDMPYKDCVDVCWQVAGP